MSTTTEKPSKDTALGAIQSDSVYPLPVFKKKVGLDAWSLREAKKRGLKIRKIGRRRFIVGSDFIEYLRSLKPCED
jgi:hypothetical protein